MTFKLATLAAAVAGIQSVAAQAAVTMPLSRTEGLERARSVLKVHCGACHDPMPVPASPKALAVYDLSEPDWSAKLNARQLQSMSRRLVDRASMSPSELREVVPRGFPAPAPPKVEEVSAVQAYIGMELSRRSEALARSGADTWRGGASEPKR